MTLELNVRIRQMAATGLGWEDICHKLGIRDRLGRKLVRDLTLFHVKHVQPRETGRAVS